MKLEQQDENILTILLQKKLNNGELKIPKKDSFSKFLVIPLITIRNCNCD